MSSLISSYENFILKNQKIIETIESVGRFIVLFTINPEDEVRTELAYTGLNLVSLYHENLLDRKSVTNKLLLQDERFSIYKKISYFLRFLQTIQVVIELYLKKKSFKESNVWKVILLIESLKAFTRLFIIYKSKYNVMIEDTILPNDFQLNLEYQENQRDSERNGKFSKTFDSLNAEPIGKRTGKLMPTLNYKVPSLRKENLLVVKSTTGGQSKNFIFGEMIFALRPCIYVLSLMKWGNDSWTPLVISFLTDLISRQLSLSDVQGRGSIVKDELYRRYSSLYYYLVRNPLFNESLKPIIVAICNKLKNVPALGPLVVNIVEYMLVLQNYYFYTCSN
eukprot:gene2038-1545_t